MHQIVTSKWLMDVFREYPNHQVVFSPIRHSEYTVDFHMKNGIWYHEYGDKLLHSLIQYKDNIATVYGKWLQKSCNGYANDADEPTWLITAAVYMREDNILIIMA